MGHVVQFPRKQHTGAADETDLPCPPVHHSIGVGTIVALLRAHQPERPVASEVEEKVRLDSWVATDALPEDRADPRPG